MAQTYVYTLLDNGPENWPMCFNNTELAVSDFLCGLVTKYFQNIIKQQGSQLNQGS